MAVFLSHSHFRFLELENQVTFLLKGLLPVFVASRTRVYILLRKG